MISYDPSKAPEITSEELKEAGKYGLVPVNIMCDEPNAGVGDATGVSFIAFVKFIPRVGDFLVLQDGKRCVVESIYHVVGKVRGDDADIVITFPNVYATIDE